jgi:hypothetical protein
MLRHGPVAKDSPRDSIVSSFSESEAIETAEGAEWRLASREAVRWTDGTLQWAADCSSPKF